MDLKYKNALIDEMEPHIRYWNENKSKSIVLVFVGIILVVVAFFMVNELGGEELFPFVLVGGVCYLVFCCVWNPRGRAQDKLFPIMCSWLGKVLEGLGVSVNNEGIAREEYNKFPCAYYERYYSNGSYSLNYLRDEFVTESNGTRLHLDVSSVVTEKTEIRERRVTETDSQGRQHTKIVYERVNVVVFDGSILKFTNVKIGLPNLMISPGGNASARISVASAFLSKYFQISSEESVFKVHKALTPFIQDRLEQFIRSVGWLGVTILSEGDTLYVRVPVSKYLIYNSAAYVPNLFHSKDSLRDYVDARIQDCEKMKDMCKVLEEIAQYRKVF